MELFNLTHFSSAQIDSLIQILSIELTVSVCALQIESAAEEPRVLCIVQDTTNAKTVNERLTLNLPASTTVSKLYEDVAQKAGYVNGTFCMVWASGINTVRVFCILPMPFSICL